MLAKALQGAALATIPAYIEDVFSTWLYTGNDTSQTITNNIDLSTKGGMVWIKARSGTYSTGYNVVNDTARGAKKDLYTNTTGAESANTQGLTSFNTTGFAVGNSTDVNGGSTNLVSWTFRKQAKFFDVVTYTGNGSNPRTIAHNLGSTPGCIIVKETNAAGNWAVWHRSLGDGYRIFLNLTNASTNVSAADWFGTSNSTITATDFTVGSNLNTNGRTLVAYLFAHDAGGFGAAGTDNVISCGSYTGNGGTNNVINIGYEAQFVLIKATSGSTAASQNWCMYDVMRGMPTGTALNDNVLFSNLANAETTVTGDIAPHATGFVLEGNDARVNSSANTYIYIAIRRGPMRTPTSGTSVFSPDLGNGTVKPAFTSGFPVDLGIQKQKSSTNDYSWSDRLRGNTQVSSAATDAETGPFAVLAKDFMDGWGDGTTFGRDSSYISWMFRRAPGFFDVVCYTGNGSARTISHNLGVAPEMMIMKARTVGSAGPYNWIVYHTALSAGGFIYLNLTNAGTFSGNTSFWNGTAPTSSVFSLGGASGINENTYTYVAYLFATLAGVSKVGSYDGNGTSKTIDCGFTAGARFVMIKRTDSTGDWYVWDTARGIVSGNDPHLSLNTTAAEVTTNDTIDPDNSGFIVNQVAATNVNVNNASYIFLAVS